MKELWVEISADAALSQKAMLQKLAAENADFLLENTSAHSCSGKDEVTVLNSLDEKVISQLKQSGKRVALKMSIKGKEDENTAVKAAELSADYIIINCLDWRVIPLENLIARTHGKSKLIAEVSNAEDTKLVLETLELGADGVLLQAIKADELKKTVAIVKKQAGQIVLRIL